jgi:hypothetical protein
MILKTVLFVLVCVQTQTLLPMMEEISKTGGTPADLLDSLKKKSCKGNEHAQKNAEDDLSAMETSDLKSAGELMAAQQEKKVRSRKKEHALKQAEQELISIAQANVPKVVAPIEIRTIVRDETREVNECLASLLLGCNNYWSDPKSCDKVVFALKKLKNFGEPMPQRTWLSYRCQLFARARAALDDARICREQVLKGKRFVKSDQVESFTALENAHFNLELLEQFDKYITERKQKRNG